MDVFESQDIIKVLNALIGPVCATGDSAKDGVVLENLGNLIDVTTWCIENIRESAYDRARPEDSMKRIGKKAFETLVDYHDWLERLTYND